MAVNANNPVITAGQQARRVAMWITDRFAGASHEHGANAILQSELIRRAWNANIDLVAWYPHPVVQATGIRGVMAEIYPGRKELFFTLEPEGSE